MLLLLGAFYNRVTWDKVIDARCCSTAYLLRGLWQSAIFTRSLLLIVLWNMAEYLSDDVGDNFEYDGRP